MQENTWHVYPMLPQKDKKTILFENYFFWWVSETAKKLRGDDLFLLSRQLLTKLLLWSYKEWTQPA